MGKLSGKSGRIKYGSAATITAATHSGGVVTVTATDHGFSEGEFVLIESVAGMTDLNNDGKGFVIASAPDADTFTVALSTEQSYTSGGTATRIIPITQWTLNETNPTINASDSESGDWEEHIEHGRKGWTASFSAVWWDGQTAPPTGELSLQFDIDSNNYYSGSGFVNSKSINLDNVGANPVSLSGEIQGTNSLTLTKN